MDSVFVAFTKFHLYLTGLVHDQGQDPGIAGEDHVVVAGQDDLVVGVAADTETASVVSATVKAGVEVKVYPSQRTVQKAGLGVHLVADLAASPSLGVGRKVLPQS